MQTIHDENKHPETRNNTDKQNARINEHTSQWCKSQTGKGI